MPLIDVAVKNGPEIEALFAEAGNVAPELDFLGIDIIPNRSKTRKYRVANSGATSTGDRDLYDGVDATKGTYGKEDVKCGIQTTYLEVDKADLNTVGDETAKAEYMTSESEGGAEEFRGDIGYNIYYNTYDEENEKGWNGLQAKCDASMIVDVCNGVEAFETGEDYAVGALAYYTADGVTKLYKCVTAQSAPESFVAAAWEEVPLTSVYLLYSGNSGRAGKSGVKLHFGGNGKIENPEWKDEKVYKNGKPFPAFTSLIEAYPCVSRGDKSACIRIANITNIADYKMIDELAAKAIDKLPAAIKADKANLRFAMTTRSVSQVRKARNAVNATGTPAPYPTEMHGIKIMETDSIIESETFYTAS